MNKLLKDIIHDERITKNLSLSEVARRSGHAVSTLHGIESGINSNPSFKTIGDIAAVLNISLSDIYTDMASGLIEPKMSLQTLLCSIELHDFYFQHTDKRIEYIEICQLGWCELQKIDKTAWHDVLTSQVIDIITGKKNGAQLEIWGCDPQRLEEFAHMIVNRDF